MWYLSFLPRDQTLTPCSRSMGSNHWATREVPFRISLRSTDPTPFFCSDLNPLKCSILISRFPTPIFTESPRGFVVYHSIL